MVRTCRVTDVAVPGLMRAGRVDSRALEMFEKNWSRSEQPGGYCRSFFRGPVRRSLSVCCSTSLLACGCALAPVGLGCCGSRMLPALACPPPSPCSSAQSGSRVRAVFLLRKINLPAELWYLLQKLKKYIEHTQFSIDTTRHNAL